MLNVLEIEGLIADQGQDPPWSPHHDVGAVGLHHLLVLLDADPSKEDRRLDVVKVFAESLVLFVDLERQLPVMVCECGCGKG